MKCKEKVLDHDSKQGIMSTDTFKLSAIQAEAFRGTPTKNWYFQWPIQIIPDI